MRNMLNRIIEVSYGDNKPPLRINLNYQYTYDDIRAILTQKAKSWQESLQEKKITNIYPIIVPEYEISQVGDKSQVGSLSHYLLMEKKTYENKAPCNRVLAIPYNTGGHWLALMLYIRADNTLASACCIDSFFSMENGPFPMQLQRRALIDLQIREAYSGFTLPIYVYQHYIQTDGSACGVLAIENLGEMFQRVYFGYRHPLGRNVCDGDSVARFRARHLRLLGGTTHSLYQKQLENKHDVASFFEQHTMLNHLSRNNSLTEQGSNLVANILKLSDAHKKILMLVFLQRESEEEIKGHYQQIRKTLLEIKQELVKNGEAAERAAFIEILALLYGLTSDSIVLEESFNFEGDFKMDHAQMLQASSKAWPTMIRQNASKQAAASLNVSGKLPAAMPGRAKRTLKSQSSRDLTKADVSPASQLHHSSCPKF